MHCFNFQVKWKYFCMKLNPAPNHYIALYWITYLTVIYQVLSFIWFCFRANASQMNDDKHSINVLKPKGLSHPISFTDCFDCYNILSIIYMVSDKMVYIGRMNAWRYCNKRMEKEEKEEKKINRDFPMWCRCYCAIQRYLTSVCRTPWQRQVKKLNKARI